MALTKSEKRIYTNARSGILFSTFLGLFMCCFFFYMLVPDAWDIMKHKIEKRKEVFQASVEGRDSSEMDRLVDADMDIQVSLAKSGVMLCLIFLVFYNILWEKRQLSNALFKKEIEPKQPL